MNQRYQMYLVTYRYEGADWHLEFSATSFDDARRRLSQISLGRVDGISIAKLPAVLGPIAAFAALARNALTR